MNKQVVTDLLPESKALTDEQWQKYERLLNRYFSGAVCGSGWLAVIENAMIDAGVDKTLAFKLATLRHDLTVNVLVVVGR